MDLSSPPTSLEKTLFALSRAIFATGQSNLAAFPFLPLIALCRGNRFSYTHYYPEPAPSTAAAIRLGRSVVPNASHPIHESITRLDHEAMTLLTLPSSTAADAHTAFAKYLTETKNTICGRHPIGVLMGAMAFLEREKGIQPTLKWVRYEQSSACLTIRDSSVSYASAWVRF
jgi:predicted class III extradiol MEMO1 family dioxygenase